MFRPRPLTRTSELGVEQRLEHGCTMAAPRPSTRTSVRWRTTMWRMFGAWASFNQDIGGWSGKQRHDMMRDVLTPRPSTRTSAGAWTTTWT